MIDGFVDPQGLRDVGALVKIVGVEGLNFLNASVTHLAEKFLGDFVVGFGDQFPGVCDNQVTRQRAAKQEIFGNADPLYAGLIEFADMLGGDALIFCNDQFTIAIIDVKTSNLATQALDHQVHHRAFRLQTKAVELEVLREDLLSGHANGFEQNRGRHFAPTINTEIKNIFWIKLEVKPGPAIRNDSCGKKQLARAMGLTAVVLEKHTGRTV